MQNHSEGLPEWLDEFHTGSKRSTPELEQQLKQQQQQLKDMGIVLNHLAQSIQNQHLVVLEQNQPVGEISSNIKSLIQNQSQFLNQGKTISALYNDLEILATHQKQLQDKIDKNYQVLIRHANAFAKYTDWKATAIRYGIIALIMCSITIVSNAQRDQQITKLLIKVEQIWKQVKPR